MLKEQASGEQGWWVLACTLKDRSKINKCTKGTSQYT